MEITFTGIMTQMFDTLLLACVTDGVMVEENAVTTMQLAVTEAEGDDINTGEAAQIYKTGITAASARPGTHHCTITMTGMTTIIGIHHTAEEDIMGSITITRQGCRCDHHISMAPMHRTGFLESNIISIMCEFQRTTVFTM